VEETLVVVRIAGMSLRGLFALNLILGLLFWFGIAEPRWLVLIHMLIGVLFVAAIWLLGLAQGLQKNGSLGLVVGTFVVGLIIAIFGLIQQSLLPTSAHWVIQVIHLLLAVAGIGLGEAAGARYQRGAAAASANPA
jgi:phosphoglycerol transferase MdoB-like AlkP superfamily enzyme